MKSISDYYRLDFPIAEKENELLLAKLSILSIESFVVEPEKIEAYLPVSTFSKDIENELNILSAEFDTVWTKELLPAQNWNQVWESNFSPIRIDDFCHIIADFHTSIPTIQHELVIQPLMAFGTGHHETTYMMIHAMKGVDFQGKTVLDYGCGTGILAILAEKLGASAIEAIDYDATATENTLVNVGKNNCKNIVTKTGELSVSEKNQFEIILANINRTIILGSLKSLYNMLPDGGNILFSGIMKADKAMVFEAAEKEGFILKKKYYLNEWICIHFGK